jgi:hypothetical protein
VTGSVKDNDLFNLAVGYQDKYPASALYYYKCLWKNMRPEELWAPGMKICYELMNRKILSDNVDNILRGG